MQRIPWKLDGISGTKCRSLAQYITHKAHSPRNLRRLLLGTRTGYHSGDGRHWVRPHWLAASGQLGRSRLMTSRDRVLATTLSINQNKDDLSKYLSTELISATANTTTCCVISTSGQNSLTNQPLDLSCLSPTDHEEADSRMKSHLQQAVMAGHKVAFVRTVDSDVVVLSIHHYPAFQNLGLTDLWIGIGCRKNYRDIPVHEVSAQLGSNRCLALPFFHAFTGSDLTSSMFGIGKKTAWNAWLHCPGLTETIVTLMHQPEELTEDSVHMRRIERLTVQMYDKNCSCTTVNEARQMLFTHNLRNLECIPPTKAALYHHAKRAVFVFCLHMAWSIDKRITAPSTSRLWVGMEYTHWSMCASLDTFGRC